MLKTDKIARIIFIDDDQICAFLNVALVEELGIAKEVVSLPGGEEALAYLQDHYSSQSNSDNCCQDLLFLDARMPGMDGYEFLEALENLHHINKRRFSIILLTASLLPPADIKKVYHHNDAVFASLTKPLKVTDLEKIVAEVCAVAN